MKERRHVFTTWLMDKDIPTEETMMKMLDDEDVGFSPIKLYNIMASI
jgi:hypothetical protein